jgi:hypothetical protein
MFRRRSGAWRSAEQRMIPADGVGWAAAWLIGNTNPLAPTDDVIPRNCPHGSAVIRLS